MREKIHNNIYFVGLSLIAIFMPISEYITNATIILLSLNYLIEANYTHKFNKLKNNTEILFFILLFFIPVIWLLFSNNLNFGLHDIKIKLPLLALPIIISSSKQLKPKQIKNLSLLFIFGVLLSTLAGLLAYFNVIFKTSGDNVRNYSVFISHITLSVMISLSILLLVYYILKKLIPNKLLTAFAILTIIWFLIFLAIIQGFTGLSTLIITSIIILSYKVFNQKNKLLKIQTLIVLILLIGGVSTYLGFQVKQFYTASNPNIKQESYTIYGNAYYSDTSKYLLENGNYIYFNVCEKELKTAWSNRSTAKLSDKDSKGQILLHTLIRYMSSKGLNKDAEGVNSLNDQDIINIEYGYTNYRFVKNRGISQRIYNIIWQIDFYLKGGSPNGHSITQRFEYQKYGFILAKRNFWIGTGTGDLDDQYKGIYNEYRSKLAVNNRHRAHNQFLTFYISFGIIGASLCLIAWFYPVFNNFNSKSYYFLVFFLLTSFAMLTDDMFETSTSMVFISYFYSLFSWAKN